MENKTKARKDIISLLMIIPGVIYMFEYEDINWLYFSIGSVSLFIGLIMRVTMYTKISLKDVFAKPKQSEQGGKSQNGK